MAKVVRVQVRQSTSVRATVTPTQNRVTVSQPSTSTGTTRSTVFGYGPPPEDVPKNVLYLDMDTGDLYEFGG